jgi:gas vesicle protein
MEGRTTYSTELLCFLVGGATGAALALLWAPQSGRSTRQLMGRKLRDTVDSARAMKHRATRMADDIRGEAGRRLDQAASALAGDAAPGKSGDAASA